MCTRPSRVPGPGRRFFSGPPGSPARPSRPQPHPRRRRRDSRRRMEGYGARPPPPPPGPRQRPPYGPCGRRAAPHHSRRREELGRGPLCQDASRHEAAAGRAFKLSAPAVYATNQRGHASFDIARARARPHTHTARTCTRTRTCPHLHPHSQLYTPARLPARTHTRARTHTHTCPHSRHTHTLRCLAGLSVPLLTKAAIPARCLSNLGKPVREYSKVAQTAPKGCNRR